MRDYKLYTIAQGRQSNGAGNIIFSDDFRHAMLSVQTTGSTNATISIVGSYQENAPNFNNPSTPTNEWGYVQIRDTDDNSPTDGSYGIQLVGTDKQYMFEINTNGMRHITAVISNYIAGSINIKIKLYSV